MSLGLLPIFAPIFGTILLGLLLRRCRFPGESFWPAAEKITYYLLFPALLVLKIGTVRTAALDTLPLVAALLCTFLAMTLLLLMGRNWLSPGGPAFTSLFQGTVRFNTYIGLTIILAAYGEGGILVAALIMAVLIPLVNVLSVIVLLRYGRGRAGRGGAALILSILRNPVVLACLAGILINGCGITIPPPLAGIMALLGKASLPLGLLTVGAGLDFTLLHSSLRPVISSAILKLFGLPALMQLFCMLFGVQQKDAAIAVLFAALPGSALSFILARQLGGDGRLMSAIVSVQTCLALFSMPLVFSLAGILA